MAVRVERVGPLVSTGIALGRGGHDPGGARRVQRRRQHDGGPSGGNWQPRAPAASASASRTGPAPSGNRPRLGDQQLHRTGAIRVRIPAGPAPSGSRPGIRVRIPTGPAPTGNAFHDAVGLNEKRSSGVS